MKIIPFPWRDDECYSRSAHYCDNDTDAERHNRKRNHYLLRMTVLNIKDNDLTDEDREILRIVPKDWKNEINSSMITQEDSEITKIPHHGVNALDVEDSSNEFVSNNSSICDGSPGNRPEDMRVELRVKNKPSVCHNLLLFENF